MHIKRIHEMVERLTECTKSAIENDEVCVGQYPIGDVVDMIKDLCCAEKDALIAKEMKKCEEEDEVEEKYFLKMLKEEYKDEYKRMREEYGDSEETDRRFYDAWRYKSSGRFAPKGHGTRYGRKGYDEPPYYHMTPDMMGEHDPEYWRDLDRSKGRLYFSEPMSNADMRRDMSKTERMRDYREGRSGQSRRNYMETKEINRGNTPEEKQKKMKELESYMKELSEDVTEMISDATPEEKSLLKQKLQVLMQKI